MSYILTLKSHIILLEFMCILSFQLSVFNLSISILLTQVIDIQKPKT